MSGIARNDTSLLAERKSAQFDLVQALFLGASRYFESIGGALYGTRLGCGVITKSCPKTTVERALVHRGHPPSLLLFRAYRLAAGLLTPLTALKSLIMMPKTEILAHGPQLPGYPGRVSENGGGRPAKPQQGQTPKTRARLVAESAAPPRVWRPNALFFFFCRIESPRHCNAAGAPPQGRAPYLPSSMKGTTASS